MRRDAHELDMILNHDAVEDHGRGRGSDESITVESRRREHDVEDVPLTIRTAGIHERRVLSIERSRLSVGIGLIRIRAEDLHFVATIDEEDAAVAPRLSVAFAILGNHPFDVDLAVAEGRLGLVVARPRLHLHHAIPGHRPSLVIPGVEALARSDQDDRVARWRSRAVRGAGRARGDHRRLWPILGVDVPGPRGVLSHGQAQHREACEREESDVPTIDGEGRSRSHGASAPGWVFGESTRPMVPQTRPPASVGAALRSNDSA